MTDDPRNEGSPEGSKEIPLSESTYGRSLDQVLFAPPLLASPAEAMPPGNPVSEAPQASAPSAPAASDE